MKWNTEERVQAITDFFARNLDFQNKRVLDIGCNTGHFTQAALSLGASHVTAIDQKRGFTKQTQAVSENCETVTTDIFEYEFPQSDIIICCGVIYHTERQLELLQKMSATSKNIFVEGMVSSKEEPVLEIRTNRPTPLWVPSHEYYKKLFSFAGLQIDSHFSVKTDRVIFLLH